jgi:hypothetical protein
VYMTMILIEAFRMPAWRFKGCKVRKQQPAQKLGNGKEKLTSSGSKTVCNTHANGSQ